MCQLLPDSQLLRQVNGSVSAGGEFWPFTDVYFLNERFRDLDRGSVGGFRLWGWFLIFVPVYPVPMAVFVNTHPRDQGVYSVPRAVFADTLPRDQGVYPVHGQYLANWKI